MHASPEAWEEVGERDGEWEATGRRRQSGRAVDTDCWLDSASMSLWHQLTCTPLPPASRRNPGSGPLLVCLTESALLPPTEVTSNKERSQEPGHVGPKWPTSPYTWSLRLAGAKRPGRGFSAPP
ncbi:hypothetical protein DPEC_G00185720 [Dallia pectoralis]|uniref:Uncharacterized protein n=1 Tax=Dallia pectoralis TaxID=75939 RepID=A0ACC2GBU3_DALPE|nr:hypothetical protein DPEC_G00185720 [Dallia pectoralis]